MHPPIDERRQNAYLNLIDQLIGCPNGEEPDVLDAHPDLIDAGLVQTLVKVATTMAHQGNPDTAQNLVHVARKLSRRLGFYAQTSKPFSTKTEASQLERPE
ncbi:MAG TPA: hypothetical protein DCE56_40675 [Cyanobacteria bacterium UBA8553]|nr:hypothetical protein [Cyanobacteria bacterium UBA8553]HAJ62835.1 hypothetical protein [Cyanobacteria bacterium UBA8543]